MKKIIYFIFIILLLVGCNNKTIKKQSNRPTRTMLTCSNKDITYMFYFDDENEPYYKATYLERKTFSNSDEVKLYQSEFENYWKENFLDELIEYEMLINDNVLYINVTAIHDTQEEHYKYFFGNRYNLNMKDINKSFNNECLIKPIKK